MGASVLKMTARSIRASFGRYAALLLIVALSVGFFAGLKLTKPDMQKTLELYTEKQNMYDFRLVSTLGFDGDSVTGFTALDGAACAEGAQSADALVSIDQNVKPYKLMSVPEKINMPSLTAGRMPLDSSECLADADAFSEEDIGKTVFLSADNKDDVLELIDGTEFTIVGLAETPLYLGSDRGSTTLSGGELAGFIYLLPEAFTSETYAEVYIKLEETVDAYSDEYDALIDGYEDDVSTAVRLDAERRYERILDENGLTEETAEYAGVEKAKTYVLTRNENSGYVSFESDTSIVSGIANVFPVFFILVAMLVCVTTMSRMVFEERTQLGVLRALGFSNAAIIAKYMLYAGSATLLGWAAGYALGTRGIPRVFWWAYESLYDFSALSYRFDLRFFFGTLAVALAGTLGSTYFSCRRSMAEQPADLLRPKPPKAGKRILLERVGFMWRRLSFLQKVSVRNMFHSKKRLVMMIVGISGCTALLVTGFGVRDSLLPVGTLQYETIQKYDLEAEFSAEQADIETALNKAGAEDYILCAESRVDVKSGGEKHTVQLLCFDAYNADDYFSFRDGGRTLSFPKTGEALLSRQTADKLGVASGDSVSVCDADGKEFDVQIAGVFDNYIDNFIVISADTYTERYEEYSPNAALVLTDDAELLAAELLKTDEISGVTVLADKKAAIDDTLTCLDYIILLIILFAGALAFVVIYNLTNINLSERSREIATVKVLGFYPRETNAYILRENMILSVFAGLIGLPLGVALHHFVLYMIDVDNLKFPIRIESVSYLFAFVLTLLFAALVNLYMRRKVERIRMAESLKSVE